MTYRTIMYPLQIGASNPILRNKATHVQHIDQNIISFADDLLELMREYKGVGLAAPQIGKPRRIIATTQRQHTKKKDRLLSETVMINPKIVEHSTDTFIQEEGCLSLPDIHITIRRYKTITVQFQDTQDKEQIMKLEGFNAAIVQHEIDHLNGILIVDKQ